MTGQDEPAFVRHMTELLELTGAEVPDGLDGHEWASAARAAVIASLPSDGPWPEAVASTVVRTIVNDPFPVAYNELLKFAVHSGRRRQVMEALIGVLENGTNAEKTTAAGAWYWSRPIMTYRGQTENLLTGKPVTPTEESQRELDAVADLQIRWNQTALREFVANEDRDVRRSILELLPLSPADYPDDLRDLVATAANIARAL